jgi:hypothetical protein
MDRSQEGEDEEGFYDNEEHTIEHQKSISSDKAPSKAKHSNASSGFKKNKYADVLVPADATPESMIEINDRLTSELEQLIVAIENQIDRVRNEKEEEMKQRRIREEPDADVRQKESELKRAQQKIQSMKKSINQMKKQIDNAYDVEKTMILENELKVLEKKHEKLLNETKSLKKVEKEQTKAFSILNEDEDADRRLQNIKNEVIKNKSELKEKNDELRNISEELKIRHSKTIEMELKCRKLTLAMNKKNTRTIQDIEDDATRDSLTEDQVNQRIAEIEDLGYEKRQEEKKYGKLIKQVEGKIKNVEHDREIWVIKLKEKEQEFRLNELRIKELKRQVPHKALKPLPKDTKPKKGGKVKPTEQKLKPVVKNQVAKKNAKVAQDVSTDIKKEHDEESRKLDHEDDSSKVGDEDDVGKLAHGAGLKSQIKKDLDEPTQPQKVDHKSSIDRKHVTLPDDEEGEESEGEESEGNGRKEEVKDRSVKKPDVLKKQATNEKPSISRKDKKKSIDESENEGRRSRPPQSNDESNDNKKFKEENNDVPRAPSFQSNQDGGFYDNNDIEDEKQSNKSAIKKQPTNTKTKPPGMSPKRQRVVDKDDNDDYESD